MTVMTLPARAEVDRNYTWNAESVFTDVNAWKSEWEQVSQAVSSVGEYKGRLSEGADTLLSALETAEMLMRRVMKLYMYAGFSQAVDTNDQQSAALMGQAGALYGRLAGEQAYIEPELLSIGLDTLRGWLSSNPKLAIYEQYLEDLFRKQKHVRSAEVEEVLGLASDAFRSVEETASLLANADIIFGDAVDHHGNKHTVSQSTIRSLLLSSDREARRTAWENYSDGYLSHKNTFANNLATAMKQDVFNMRVRGYESTLHAKLFEYNIPVEVFHNLINTFRDNLPTWHRYWRIRREALGVDTLHSYDVWAPLTNSKPKVSYQEGVEMIVEGMRPLGDDYINTLRRGCLEERWVDVYPNQGKRQGAFSWGVYDTFPFIMMSYDDTLEAMSTLAHELGHSMHSYNSRKFQPPVYSGYSMFAAEVASNFNQAMVRDYLFRTHDDPAFQIALLEEAIASNLHRYFFIMPTLARFELETHTRLEKGQPLTATDMIEIMADLFEEGYGGEMHVDRERVGITWATFGHLYEAYYTFQYSTGISAAHALAEKVLTGDPTHRDNYLSFLKAGSSIYPIDALKMAGVDMSTPEAVETTFGILKTYIDRLEALTVKA